MDYMKRLMAALNLLKQVDNPDFFKSLMSAANRAGKNAVAAGAGYGMIVFLQGMNAQAATTPSVEMVFKVVAAQVLITAVSRFLKEKYGVTLPL